MLLECFDWIMQDYEERREKDLKIVKEIVLREKAEAALPLTESLENELPDVPNDIEESHLSEAASRNIVSTSVVLRSPRNNRV